MKMEHVTIQTNKFEEEIAFYEEFAGLEIRRDMRGGEMDIVFLGSDDEGTMVEIIKNEDVEEAGGAGISIGFACGGVEETRAKLQAAGYQVTPVIVPSPGVKFFFVKDPAGVTVQFI